MSDFERRLGNAVIDEMNERRQRTRKENDVLQRRRIQNREIIDAISKTRRRGRAERLITEALPNTNTIDFIGSVFGNTMIVTTMALVLYSFISQIVGFENIKAFLVTGGQDMVNNIISTSMPLASQTQSVKDGVAAAFNLLNETLVEQTAYGDDGFKTVYPSLKMPNVTRIKENIFNYFKSKPKEELLNEASQVFPELPKSQLELAIKALSELNDKGDILKQSRLFVKTGSPVIQAARYGGPDIYKYFESNPSQGPSPVFGTSGFTYPKRNI